MKRSTADKLPRSMASTSSK